MTHLEALRMTGLFDTLRPAQLGDVVKACSAKRLSKGGILIHAGERPQGLYVIVRGTLRAFRLNPEGREQVIHTERAGSTIAEVPLFDGKPYPSTVRADEQCEVLLLPKEQMEKLLSQYPGVAQACLRLLASKLRRTAALVESISLMGVDQRISLFLLREAGKASSGRFQIPPNPLVAGRLGTVREMVSKSLSNLEKRGILSISRDRKVSILDPRRLRDIAVSGRRAKAWRELGHRPARGAGLHSCGRPSPS